MSSLAQRVLENDKGAVVYRFAAGHQHQRQKQSADGNLKKSFEALGWSHLPVNARFTGFCVGMMGDVIFLLSVLCIKDSCRASIPDKDKTELVTIGIYRFSRTPAFLCFDLMYVGALLLYGNLLTLLILDEIDTSVTVGTSGSSLLAVQAAVKLLDSAGCEDVEITWGSDPVEPVEAIMQTAGLRK